MIYSTISFLETLLSIKRAQLTQKEATNQSLFDLDSKKREVAESQQDFSSRLTGIFLGIKMGLHGAILSSTSISSSKFWFYTKAFSLLNEDKNIESPSLLFELRFQEFKQFVIAQRIKHGKLNENDLVDYITQRHAEVGDAPISEYVNQFNTSFSSMRPQQHATFFFSLNRKLKGFDFEATKRLLTLFIMQNLDALNWTSFVSDAKFDLTLEDFVYLISSEIMDNEVNEEEVCFLESLIPEFRQATEAYKEQKISKGELIDDCTPFNFPPSFFNKLGEFALHSPLFMRILSLRSDLLKHVNVNKCALQQDGSVKPNSFFMLKMMAHDDVVFANIINSKFFSEVDLSKNFLLTNKINPDEMIAALKAVLIQKNRRNLWDHLSTMDLLISDAEMKLEAESQLARIPILKSWYRFSDMIEQGDKQAANAELENVFLHIKSFFNEAKNHPFIRKLMVSDLALTKIFTMQVEAIYSKNNDLVSSREAAKRMIAIIETSDQKDHIWDNIIAQSETLINETKEARESIRKSVFALSATFKEKYYAILRELKAGSANKKETIKKPAQNTLKENKKIIAITQQKNQTENVALPVAVPAKSPVKQAKKQVTDLLPQPEPQPEREKTLTLSEEDKLTFEQGIRAVMAGSPDIAIDWTPQKDKEPGYFTVDFSQMGDTIKVNGGLNQTYWFAAFSAEKKEAFFKTYVLNMLQKKLSSDVSANIENNILKVIPKKQHCSYPVALHEASFKHLKNHVTLSVCRSASLSLQGQQNPVHKKSGPYLSLLAKPEVSLASTKKVAPSSQASANTVSTVDLIMRIKTLLQEAVADHFKEQGFHFLTIKKGKTKCVIKFNLKGAPCLSNNEQKKVDTYIVMKSLVSALQALCGEQSASIYPDTLDPSAYQAKKCKISMDVSKENLDRLTQIAPNELRTSFNHYLTEFKRMAELYKAIDACEQEMQGGYKQEVITLNQVTEKPDVVMCKYYQQLTVEKPQRKCIAALLNEVKVLNELEASTDEPCVLEGIKANRYVCYHRLFDNLADVFDKNKDKTNASFANTLRVIFRHGYKELTVDFAAFLEAFVAALMHYKKESTFISSAVLAGKSCFLSFEVEQTMQEQLVAGLKIFFQAKSNHAIGDESRDKRIASLRGLKKAIKEISRITRATIDETRKRALILSIASLIGEVDKGAPYGKIYGEMGTHANNVSEMPVALMERVYEEHWVSSKQCGIKKIA